MNESGDNNRAGADPGETPPDEVPTTPTPTVDPAPRRFMRSRDDRIIAGVGGGLGRYFDIDPLIIRIAFAVSVLFGGLGIVAYLAVALFAPSDDGTGVPVERGRGREIARVLGILAIAAAAVSGFAVLVGGAVFVTGLGYGVPVAAAVVVIGIALAALSFRGNARWLLVPALALSIGVGVAAAADLDFEGGVGERDFRPVSASAIPAGGYELGVGRLAVDLRGIEWKRQQTLSLDARVGAGQLVVAVPSDVCIVADAHAGAGMIRVAGLQSDGVDVDLTTAEGARGTPQLQINADADVGEIRVINDDDLPIAKLDRLPDEPFERGEALRAANTRACAA